MRLSLPVLLITGLSLFAALPASAQSPVTVNLTAQNASGIAGTATLTQVGNDLQVVVELTGTAAGSTHPMHIHTGVCPNPGAVVHPLTNLVDGASTTLIAGATLASVSDGNHAINVHESATTLSNFLSCGNIAKQAMAEPTKAAAATAAPTAVSATSATTTTMPATLPKTGGAAQPWMLVLAALAIAAGLAARRRAAVQAR